MNPVLRTESLSCGYSKSALLSGLDLAVEPGQAVAIVGPNGVGKTTLLRTVAGLLAPLSGSVWVQDQDLFGLSSIRRARQVALLPQEDWGDKSLTVQEMVQLGRTPYLGLWGHFDRQDHTSVSEALSACQLSDLAARRLDQISGGERQRARIALTLAQSPALLLLDEPVNHLDLRRRHEFYQLLARLRAQRRLAVVMVLHDLVEAYREADRVLVLSDGRAAEIPVDDPLRARRLAEAFGVPEDRIPI